MKYPVAVFTSDWHLTDRKPICREEEPDWYKAQFRVIDEILHFTKNEMKDVPLVIAGDIFDKASEASIMLLSMLSEVFKKNNLSNVYAIAGNHDEPNHNINLIKNSCFQIAEDMGIFTNLNNKGGLFAKQIICYPFYENFTDIVNETDNDFTDIFVIHQFVYSGKKPNPNAPNYGNADNILKMFPNAKVVVAGDNHEGFVHINHDTNQTLVNCGSIIRDTAAQIDYKPRIYVVYDDFSVEPYFLDISKDKITDKHINKEKDRKDKENLFIRTIANSKDISFSFKDNLYRLSENKSCRDFLIKTYEDIKR